MSRIPLLLVNALFRYVFRQNTTAPYLTHFTSQVINGEKIDCKIYVGWKRVKKSFHQSGNCYFQAKNGIIFHPGSLFAPGVKFISADRKVYPDPDYKKDPPIEIGCFCLIGANAIILPGVKLGDYVTVGAGAVVTHSFPDNVTIVGNPARVIG